MKFSRIYRIIAVQRAYQLSELLPSNKYAYWLKLISGCLFWIRPKAKDQPIGERLRLALQTLGPVWIKFGQMMSTRHDILPKSITSHLALLQDKVTAFDGEIAVQIIEEALGAPLTDYFDEFDLTPLASASIAQVHTATMKHSQIPVVVKVLRPNIRSDIQADISLMYWIAEKLTTWIKGGIRLRANEIVNNYEQTLIKELNLRQEAYNTYRLRENFIDSQVLYIPYVYQELCRENVLVEERISGIPISNIEALHYAGVNLPLLAERGVEIFFTQVFRDNFFHADMHPGNIFIDISDPQDPRYIGIDCAIVGELTRQDQQYLAENFIAFFNRDYRKIAQLYIDSGWVPEETNVYDFEMAMREVCEPIFAKSLGEISFAHVLFSLFNVARRFNMEVQPQLILLEKTLFYIEGLGRQLYPELDLWKTAKPFLEDWYAEQMSVKALFRQITETLPVMSRLLPELPNQLKAQHRINQVLKSKLDHLSYQLYTAQRRQLHQSYILTAIVIAAVAFIVLY
ncbi:MAG: ubiquinone biosynthesis regulatory protein kinase UbiB [Candidatus Schmidhempelia sp.]|nr:ubiquinone biosynthesis regulatory protein kinase UbiB [Candidatus Schmidhempelia sp.]